MPKSSEVKKNYRSAVQERTAKGGLTSFLKGALSPSGTAATSEFPGRAREGLATFFWGATGERAELILSVNYIAYLSSKKNH